VQEVSEGSLTLSTETYLVVKIYELLNSGGFVTKTQVNTDGSFKIEGLNPENGYHLKLMFIDSGEIVKSQWAGKNTVGTLERLNAKTYHASDNEAILFRFLSGE